jgi:hypothetical protein
MSKEIEQIRGLLVSIESKLANSSEDTALRDFAAFELPEIIADVTDYLMPQLSPYEAAFYFYMFRHSIISSGTQYVRISVNKIRNIVESPRAVGGSTSQGQVLACLKRLVDKGVIRKESEPNREGTIYKILIPEQIEFCRVAMNTEIIKPDPIPNPESTVDYYNVRENRALIFDRDGYQCQYCQKQLTRFTATLDHITPVSQGGGNEYANVTTACRECNSRKTGKALADFLADGNPTK